MSDRDDMVVDTPKWCRSMRVYTAPPLLLGGVALGVMALIPTSTYRDALVFSGTRGSWFPWRVMGLLVATCATYQASMNFRDFMLPFLGETVLPCAAGGIPSESVPEGANVEVLVTGLPPNRRVIFWAAQSSPTPFPDPSTAYGPDYNNSGTATTQVNGTAVLRVRRPAGYSVGMFGLKKVTPHIHYRVCAQGGGIASRVMTVPVP